jgi:hypothetical protein
LPTRWEVEEAVMTSHIDPHGRHLLLTLLSKSDASTAEIPPRHVPTFDELTSMTGISKSTITEWMKTLTEAEWMSRESVEGESRKALRLAVGDPKAARTMRVRKSKNTDAAYRVAVQAETGHVPPGGTSHTAARYERIPPGGTSPTSDCLIKNSPTESSNRTYLDQAAAAAAASNDGTLNIDFGDRVIPGPRNPKKTTRKAAPKKAADEETHTQRVNRVAKLYTDIVKLVDFHGVRGVVDAAFKSGDYTERQIVTAIQTLADKRDPVTRTSLRIAIEGQPSWADRNANGRRGGSQHQPYRDPEDISAYKRSKI